MNQYLKFFVELPKVKEVLDAINKTNTNEISETNRDTASLISLCLKEKLERNVVIVTANLYQAQKVYDLLSGLLEEIYFYPKDDFISTELLTESFEFELDRINALKAVFDDSRKKIIVTSLTGLLNKVPKKENYLKNIVKLTKGEEIKPADLMLRLVEAGYSRSYTIEKQGEVSLRGSILDIYPINETKAYRLDFFGNEIDTIKVLDVESQRSSNEQKEIVVMPVYEVFFSGEEKKIIRFFINNRLTDKTLSDKTKEKFENDLASLDETSNYSLLQKYLSLFIKENYSFLDYIPDKTLCFFDFESIEKQDAIIRNELAEYLSNFKGYLREYDFLNSLDFSSYNNTVFFTNQKRFSAIKDCSLPSRDVSDYESRYDVFVLDLKNLYNDETVLLSLSEKTLPVISDMLKENKISFHLVKDVVKKGCINLLSTEFIPFDFREDKIVSITEDKIFKSHKTRSGTYMSEIETKRLKSISELKVGDYVVHYDYGIGQFLEITSMTLGGRTCDYIHIKYDGDDSVYIPTENFSILSKYAGEDGYVPKLSKLNSGEWEKTKTSVRHKAADLAQKLLQIYSKREETSGFKYLPDDEVQSEFESDFQYELTKDQADAIAQTKTDMESGKLMDRLVCGDVGFGKTEVALRAAFKAVLSGKQVAYLAPTTILARQHYYTFKERMDKFGVEVGLLSRFVAPKEIKATIEKTKKGLVDVVIGTHRLLSKDIQFKDLGLVIIDEEQRFGVEAKEKLKEIKMSVDVLTLTATPIPRTLQMAITGIKNISLIETAPKGRYPIQTYVLERNDYIVKDAIERELSKGGQVFYLFNRIDGINSIGEYVHKLVPDARIAIIHGQMDKETIEDTIESFINKNLDVLISTTIIETGIDIPNVNTLIIHDADRYGLSQLYQIKGRVGRSDKISYAYLMYDKNKVLTDDAAKRLQAIKDFTELGSGFKIAVRDLTTRGAGEILGREQSGFMNKVGVELYLKLLDEEVKKLEGKEPEKKEEDLKVVMSRHLDPGYISDDYMKIEVHTKISKLASKKELSDYVSELTDRFGPVNDNLLEYMYAKLYENLLNRSGFERVEIDDEKVVMVIGAEKSKTTDASSLFKYAYDISQLFGFYYKARKIFLVYNSKSTKLRMYQDLSAFLEKALNESLL